ncbi:MAG: hypothetical protein HFH93_07905 [Lachnospiraceae bacterium]|nr:hypothetical protein [Lachnospiraceae bacterium]
MRRGFFLYKIEKRKEEKFGSKLPNIELGIKMKKEKFAGLGRQRKEVRHINGGMPLGSCLGRRKRDPGAVRLGIGQPPAGGAESS